jgi:hypothetical protein
MNFLRQSALLMIITLLLLPGCGSKDVHGDLTVSGSSSAVVAGAANVSFTMTYSRPEGGPYDGVNLAVTTTLDGATYINSTETLSSSGSKILTYNGIPSGSTIRLQAQYGDLISSASVTVANATLTVTPSTNFIFIAAEAIGATRLGTINGGTAPFTATSTTTDISASVSGTVLTVRLNVVGTGLRSATVTVKDASGQSVLVPVTY